MRRLWRWCRGRLPKVLPPNTTWSLHGTSDMPELILVVFPDGEVKLQAAKGVHPVHQVSFFHRLADRIEHGLVGCMHGPEQ